MEDVELKMHELMVHYRNEYMSGDLSQDKYDKYIKSYFEVKLETCMQSMKAMEKAIIKKSFEHFGFHVDFDDKEIKRFVLKKLYETNTAYKWFSLQYKFYLFCKNKNVDKAKDMLDQLEEFANELSVDMLDDNGNLHYYNHTQNKRSKGEGAFIDIMNVVRDDLAHVKYIFEIIS